MDKNKAIRLVLTWLIFIGGFIISLSTLSIVFGG